MFFPTICILIYMWSFPWLIYKWHRDCISWLWNMDGAHNGIPWHHLVANDPFVQNSKKRKTILQCHSSVIANQRCKISMYRLIRVGAKHWLPKSDHLWWYVTCNQLLYKAPQAKSKYNAIPLISKAVVICSFNYIKTYAEKSLTPTRLMLFSLSCHHSWARRVMKWPKSVNTQTACRTDVEVAREEQVLVQAAGRKWGA